MLGGAKQMTKHYEILITGEVARSFFITAEDPEHAQVEACEKWKQQHGGHLKTVKFIKAYIND